ncbi:hypothetical protein P691DRAFT_739102 [Macrolepiota fuliginosa MF-IS2]|uniref:DUF1996 domain-containing protein n=1 Tax=Macrolepiota fuliginosa MF-IS2 TaxID=1400762 RepID=A0A9P5X1H5_9AGAR|nr:hypothetical protein P691DRAFT_739102 [Macrolepiota fuliginosa MF-IS2]
MTQYLALSVSAYWLMGANNILTIQRIDPIVDSGKVSTHVHSVVGGSNFGLNSTTGLLRQSQCTSIPIPQDKSNYWFPVSAPLWDNGSFTSVEGNAVMYDIIFNGLYYLFSDVPGVTTAFPDDFRMVSGDMTLRTLDPMSFSQQAITFLCLDFQGTSTRHSELPEKRCPSGIRSQINFPSCWDGKNTDSFDHQSHVSFLSTGPDSGTCNNTNYPITIPRIFLEVYWYSQGFDEFRPLAARPDQPFVFSNGDPTGYGFHADFFNGWDEGILQRALSECNCNQFGDPACCVQKGIFNMDTTTKCFITNTFMENTTGTLPDLPGANPVQSGCYEEYIDGTVPASLDPIYIYNGTSQTPPSTGTIVVPAQTRHVSQTARGTCLSTGNINNSAWMAGQVPPYFSVVIFAVTLILV